MKLQLKDLSKKYGKRLVVNKLSLSVEEGSVYGFLGPNGAGKSTTMKMMSTLIKPLSGSVLLGDTLLSQNPQKIRALIGFLPQDANLQGKYKVDEQLVILARLRDKEKVQAQEQARALLKEVGLLKLARRKIRTLSHGQQKLVKILQAFLGDPKLILLDEPFSGLDPKIVGVVRTLITRHAKGRIIMISSHSLYDISKICDRVGFLYEGKLVKEEKVTNGMDLEKHYIKAIS